MQSGVIAEWLKKEGEVVKAGDVMAKIETDKATVDFEAVDETVIAKIIKPAGSTVNVGEPICLTVEDVSDVASFASYASPAAAAAPAAAAPAPAPAPAPVAAAPKPAPVAAPPAAAPMVAAAAAPAVAAKPAAASTTAAAPEADYVAWPSWGLSLTKGPLGAVAAKAQAAYTAAYGFSGVALDEPAPAAADKGDGKKAAKK
jgi:pyruvate dehydrogenase E2 component (dihydrolipoamide acetyltransferase)